MLALISKAEVWVHENVLGFDTRVLDYCFGRIYEIESLTDDPLRQGIPCRRPRIISIGTLQGVVQKVNKFEELHNCLQRKPVIHGDVYWCAEREEVGGLPDLAVCSCSYVWVVTRAP